MTALLLLVVGACRGPVADLHAEAGPLRAALAVPVCAEVAVKARAAGVPARLATRLAYRESRLRHGLTSSAGAMGPLQAVPRYWCPAGVAEGCDLTAAGVRALRYYLRRERGDVRRALCAYTGRRQCGAEAVAWAR